LDEGVVKIFSSKRRILAALALALLVLFLLRPGASRLKSRIVLSMSSALGRSVDIGSVHLRLLPRPGFDLNNLVVYDDPAFGAEPMLRAGEVTADLRLMSLVRGRLEVARLDLTEPSLNLVHRPNGRWNVEALLERASSTPLAPTTKAKSEPRPGFPYIEATSARINLKNGPEKKPYALTNADFSLWQDSENAWGVRLTAQPFRTDLNLNDTGLIKISGRWHRASTLRGTPLEFSLEWNRSQLGQVSKLFTGIDQGWRGGVQISATVTGTPASLQIATDLSIQDFRRYDITAGQPLRLAAHCNGRYSSIDRAFEQFVCTAPVEPGLITVRGSGSVPTRSYKLEISAENVPVRPVVALAQRTKRNLADDLAGSGSVRTMLSITKSSTGPVQMEGRGEIENFRLISASNRTAIGPQTVPFIWSGGDAFGTFSNSEATPTSSQRLTDRNKKASGFHPLIGPHLEFGSFALGAHNSGAAVRGWMNREGYSLYVTGDSEIAGMLRLAHALGIPELQSVPEGTAQLDLQIAGPWPGTDNRNLSGFTAPQLTGGAKLRDVRAEIRGAGSPIEISGADVQFSPDAVRINKINAKVAGATWTGWLQMPRGCGTPDACEVQFDLTANQIALGELREWASPPPANQPWYRVLGGPPSMPSFLTTLHASGRVNALHLQLRNFRADHFSASVRLNHGKIEATELSADFLGSRHTGSWNADFASKPAACEASGRVAGISLARLSIIESSTAPQTNTDEEAALPTGALKNPWITGNASASYHVTGSCGADFWESATGILQFDVRDGTLPHITLAEDEGPLKIVRLTGQARIREGRFEMKDASLDSADGKFQLSGTASWQRELDLKLMRTAGNTATGYSITGTLSEPRIAPRAGSEQARLKPETGK
jgi:hypothetical protein